MASLHVHAKVQSVFEQCMGIRTQRCPAHDVGSLYLLRFVIMKCHLILLHVDTFQQFL